MSFWWRVIEPPYPSLPKYRYGRGIRILARFFRYRKGASVRLSPPCPASRNRECRRFILFLRRERTPCRPLPGPRCDRPARDSGSSSRCPARGDDPESGMPDCPRAWIYAAVVGRAAVFRHPRVGEGGNEKTRRHSMPKSCGVDAGLTSLPGAPGLGPVEVSSRPCESISFPAPRTARTGRARRRRLQPDIKNVRFFSPVVEKLQYPFVATQDYTNSLSKLQSKFSRFLV